MPERSSTSGLLAVLGTALTAAWYGLASPGVSPASKEGAGPATGASYAARASAVSDKDPYEPFLDFWALADAERGHE